MSKYEEKPSLEEMRFELSKWTKITPNTPDDLVRLAYKLYMAATDKDRPGWSRYESELHFEYLASANDDLNIMIQDLRNQIQRQAEYSGDEVGRWDDFDEDARI